MKNFIKLVNFELDRVMKLYIGLLIIIFIAQFIPVIVSIQQYMIRVTDFVSRGAISPQKFVVEYGRYNLGNVMTTFWFQAPILLGIAVLSLLALFIWYRDWLAQHTFMYRLLMLPTNRMTIFYAKLTTILLTVLGAIVFQLFLLSFYQQVVRWMVPVVYREDLPVGTLITISDYLSFIIPTNWSIFLLSYGAGTVALIVLFTAILFERSYKWKGMIMGIGYLFLTFVLVVSPFLIQVIFLDDFYLYMDEVIIIEVILLLIITGCSLWMSNYLLKNKVTV